MPPAALWTRESAFDEWLTDGGLAYYHCTKCDVDGRGGVCWSCKRGNRLEFSASYRWPMPMGVSGHHEYRASHAQGGAL